MNYDVFMLRLLYPGFVHKISKMLNDKTLSSELKLEQGFLKGKSCDHKEYCKKAIPIMIEHVSAL